MRTFRSLIRSVVLCLLTISLAPASVPPHPRLLKLMKEGKMTVPGLLADKAGAAARGINALPSQLPPGFRVYKRDAAGPATTYNYLAIIVQFSDKAASTPPVSFDSLLYGAAAPSVRDYYHEVSYGTFDVVTVNFPSDSGWIMMPQTYAYYVNGNYGFGSYPNNSQKLTEDIISLIDPYVDFSQYDNNGDGYVDALSIIHTGPGAEYTGSANDIWSHAWSTPSPVPVDGVMAWSYSVQPEYWSAPGDMTIGVYAHEMGHSVFNLPDLYDYGYDSRGLGSWSLMAFGSWGGPAWMGESPMHPDAWSRCRMGFAAATNLTADTAGVQIPDVETSGFVIKLWMNGGAGNQYFLVENRQRSGYDSYIEGEGLAIYHVDEWQSGNDNQWYPGHTASGHYEVALEQADGAWELEMNVSDGDSGDVYPGSTGNTTFDSASTPGSRDYDDENTYVAVRNISPSASTMTADFEVVNPNKTSIARYVLSTFSGTYEPITGITAVTGDENAVNLTLPFAFPYDGHDYDLLRISTNGWVELGSGSRPLSATTGPVNQNLFTSAPPNRTLAPWWDDLATGAGAVEYTTLGTFPDQVFVVEWQDVLSYSSSSRQINFQVRLYEASGIVEFWYGDTSGAGSINESASIGIEDHTGGTGHFIDAPTGSTTGGTADLTTGSDWPGLFYRFQPPPLTLVRPTGGEYFFIGTTDTIRWRSIGIAGVDLEYSTDAGGSWNLIAASTPAAPQSYAWIVPDAPTTQARIRISDAAADTVADTSRADFTIQDIPVMTVDPDSLGVVLNEGDTTVRVVTIGNTGPGVLKWHATIGNAGPGTLSTLPAVTILPGETGPDGPGEREPETTAGGPESAERRLGVMSAMLADLSGKRIGMTNPEYYVVIASDLQLRGAAVHSVTFPLDTELLDSLDVLAVDDALSIASASDIDAIRAWVQAGNSLIVQGDDLSSMPAINALLSGSGISETAMGYYGYGYFTQISPHSSTVGVDTIYGYSYGSYCAVSFPAETIVLDDSGRPHVAVSRLGSGNVMAAGNEIAEGGNLAYGDTRLFVNQAFDWLATGGNFLGISPDSGTVAPGSSEELSVTFDARGLDGGDYDAAILIESNDPVNSPASVPAHLHVVGAPSIVVSDDTLDFGDAFIGYPDTLTLTIDNAGSDTLRVGAMSSDNARFTVGGDTAFAVVSHQSRDVAVILTATATGPEAGTLTISSNDSTDSLMTVHLTGNGIHPPAIGVDPDSLDVTLNEGDSTAQTITIGNTGLGDLDWSIRIVSGISGASPAPRTQDERLELSGMMASSQPSGNNTGIPTVSPYRLHDLMEKQGTTKILAWTGYADLSPTGEYENTLNAIESYFTDFSVETTSTMSPSELGVLLADKQVFLVPEQEQTSDLTALGASLSAVLGSFAGNGGTLIVMDHVYGAATRLLNGSGLMTIDNVNPVISLAVVHDPASPLVEGVPYSFISMDGSNYHGSPDGQKIVRDSVTGNNRVTMKSSGSGRVIYIGMDFYSYNPEMARLLANAVSSSEPAYLGVAPDSGTILPGSSEDVTVKFNAATLPGGDYYATLLIESNDPDDNPLPVPTHLHVIGIPNIAISDDTLDFGDAFIGFNDTLSLRVTNTGSDTLHVSGMAIDNVRFAVGGSTAFSLLPDEHRDVGILLSPLTTGPETGTLTITSNDPSDPSVAVHLAGNGIQPPAITVDPDSLYAALNEGDSTTQTITIGNTGPGELHWSATTGNTPATAAFTLPAAVIEQRENGGERGGPVGTPAAAGISGPREARLSTLNANLSDLSGVHIGLTNPSSFVLVASDLQARGAVVHSVGSPITQVKLDSLDVLAIDDAASLLTSTEIAYIRSWVEAGNGLFIQGDDSGPSLTNNNSLLTGSGITEISFFNYYTGVFTDIVPHSITEGVDSVYGNAYGSYFDVASPAQAIVFDDSGHPHVSVSYLSHGKIVAAGNEIAADFNLVVGDTRLLANQAFDWLAGIDFLTLSPDSGTVAPGGTQDLVVKFSAVDLGSGDYDAAIHIGSNDPVNNTVTVPAHLHVIGIPNIAISDDTLDFGDAFIGFSDTLSLRVTNIGSDTLHVSGMAIDNVRFAVGGSTAFSLLPDEHRDVDVLLSPVTTGPVAGTLTITSNDPSDSSVAVHLSGNGIQPPAITVVPDSFSVVLNEGDSTTQTMTIGNSGPGALEFRLENTPFVPGAMTTAGTGASQGTIDLLSTQAPGGFSARQAVEKFGPRNAAVPGEVLVVEDLLPWTSPAIDTILNHLGVPYDLVNSSGLPSVDLTGYRLIIVASDQTTSFYQALAAFGAELDNFVSGGGVLEFHGAGWGWNSGNASLVTLPGGVHIASQSASVNHVVDSLHPVMAGVPNPFTGTGTSHSYFTNLTAGTQVITVIDSPWTPTLIEYVFGDGRVIATGHTLEFGYAQGQHAGIILTNLIPYALTLGDAPWLSFDPDSGTVAPGLSQDIAVTFDARNLGGGDYYRSITVVNNDPARNPVVVPVHLHVIGVPDIAVSDDTLDFGNAWIGYGDTLGLEIVNDGSDTLDIASISTDNPEFALPGGTAFSLDQHGSHTLPVVFTPGATGIRSGTLTITSNDPNEPSLGVGLTGIGQEPPVLGMETDTLTGVELYAGDTTARTITVSNTGGSDLQVTASVGTPSDSGTLRSRALYEGRRALTIVRTSSVKSEPEGPTEGPAGGLPLPASIQDTALPVNLSDALGYLWDISNNGGIYNGTIDAFDGGFTLTGFPNFGSAATEEGGREIVIGPASIGQYTVTRKVFVPGDAAFVRYLEIVDNPLAVPLFVSVAISTNLGSDGNEVFCQTSSGDAPFTTSDRWIVTDDSPNTGDPAVVHVIAGEGGSFGAASVGGGQGYGMVSYTYNDTIPAGGTVVFMHFGAQRSNGTEGTAVAAALMHLDGGALAGMSVQERLAVANFPSSAMFTLTPPSASVPPSSSMEFHLGYNSAGAAPGSYNAEVHISSNDPAHPAQSLGASLTVFAAPNLALTDDTLDFGDAFVGYTDSMSLGIGNNGTDTLHITGMSIDNPLFAVTGGGTAALAPGETGEVQVQFTPAATGIEAGVLTILSDDPTDTSHGVALLGTGVNSAIIDADPDSLVFALNSGDSAAAPVTLANLGQASMAFSLHVVFGDSGEGIPRQYTIPLTARDNAADSLTIHFGKHPDATYEIDAALGEEELPPVPPTGVRDVRFIDIPSRPPIMGQGMRLDLRGSYGLAEVDTYRVKFQPANNEFPARLSWPGGLNSLVASMSLQDLFGGIAINVDMTETTEVSITNSAFTEVFIISRALLPWLSVSPPDGNVGAGGNLQLDVSVHTAGLVAGEYRARIVILSGDLPGGSLEIPVRLDVLTGVADDLGGIPAGFMLHQNYPNPFNPGTVIRYDVPVESHVTITIQNVLGQEVARLFDGRRHAGRYDVTFDASGLPSGVYFFRLQAEGFTDTKKLLLMK